MTVTDVAGGCTGVGEEVSCAWDQGGVRFPKEARKQVRKN